MSFPLSLGLTGLRDVRNDKVASGGGARLNTSSPFNIKVRRSQAKFMTIKSFLKKTFLQFGIYNSFRYSTFYYWLLKYKNPAYIKALNNDLAFYRDALGTNLDTVFDIGANHGDKTWVFKQLANRVVCIEPDRNCFAALSTRYCRDKSVSLENG
ncbi:hypothetical protein WA1_45300 [Scytonema hofmannii PCC 7110]|uniref:Methyltransferase FkbM domain-containing protein n=1 Tax=Scytonema hofmannii PCC 7110 TaxID=128403 RepID=A0A139WWR7_9CYAN|nr:hypothetical protein WA1_45300 [Scytonema hofmannii PCC 7110]